MVPKAMMDDEMKVVKIYHGNRKKDARLLHTAPFPEMKSLLLSNRQ